MKFLDKLRDNKGMTLVEVMSSMVILLIVVSAIGLVFKGSGKIMNESTDLKNMGNQAVMELEGNSNVTSQDGKATLTVQGGNSIEIKGKYKSNSSSRNNANVNFTAFEPE